MTLAVSKSIALPLITVVLFSIPITTINCADLPEFDAENAFAYLERQCAFGTRNPGSEGAEACLEWFVDELGNLADDVWLQPFKAVEALTGEEHSLTNVIANFPSEGGFPLMLCAHWDTRAHADLDPDPKNRQIPISGANDGASGVAVLLEIARIASEYPPPRELIIVLFDGEDTGRSHYAEEFALGSKYWAAHPIPKVPQEAILLDMIGDADLEIPVERFSEEFAAPLRKYLWEIAEKLALDAFIERTGPAVQDDHIPLQSIGIRAVDLIDFDYQYWHTIEDTPDKCSVESLDQVGRLLVAFIYGFE